MEDGAANRAVGGDESRPIMCLVGVGLDGVG